MRAIWQLIGLALVTLMIGLASCTPAIPADDQAIDEAIPPLERVDLTDGQPLQVVATTSIIGDVVGNVGGDQISLMVMMEAGQDPHSYEPTAREMADLGEADVIFVNGFGLEEGLLESIEAVAVGIPLVPVSVGIEPLPLGDHDDHDHAEGDPHVWLDPTNVIVWTGNIADTLGTLDPAHHDEYEANATAYINLLTELDVDIKSQVANISETDRLLVTNHEALGYFATRYGFEIVGAVIAGGGTDTEPSARDIATLVEVIEGRNAPAIFIETTVSESLAEVVAGEVGREVAVLTLYTGSLGTAGSGAETYLGMMRVNANTIVEGLTE